MKVTIALLLSSVYFTFAEPPSNLYGAPGQTQAIPRPNGLYGPPSNSYGPPSNTYGPPSSQYGPPSNAYLPSREEEEAPAKYEFEYHVQDDEAGLDFGHQEQRDGDVATGKYFVLLPDGRIQTVEYTADTEGYKPQISYEQTNRGGGYAPAGYPSGGYKY